MSLTLAQVVRIHISQFPVDSQVWHVGMDSALLCYIEMSSPGFLPILTWRNSTGTINTNATMKISEISTVTSTLLLSVLEFISLQPHSQLYYCNADIAGVVKTVWHYVHVENGMLMECIIVQPLLLLLILYLTITARTITNKC